MFYSLTSCGARILSDPDGAKRHPLPFTIPEHMALPLFVACGSRRSGGRVVYYVQVVAVRKSWYQRITRINAPFPFLPLDKCNTARYAGQLPQWGGEWNSLQKAIDVKSNIVNLSSGTGIVNVTVRPLVNLASQRI